MNITNPIQKSPITFNINQIPIWQANHTMPSIDIISLKVLQDFFEKEILPYEYTYMCNNNLKINFSLKKEEFCHIIFGTIDRALSNHKQYKGYEGYENIKNKTLRMDNLPNKIIKHAKFRLKAFIFLPFLLKDPKIIYFNRNIIPTGSISTSDIQADFMLYKKIQSIKMHFFVKNTYSHNKESISCVSFFHNESDAYTNNQIELKVKKVLIKPIYQLKQLPLK